MDDPLFVVVVIGPFDIGDIGEVFVVQDGEAVVRLQPAGPAVDVGCGIHGFRNGCGGQSGRYGESVASVAAFRKDCEERKGSVGEGNGRVRTAAQRRIGIVESSSVVTILNGFAGQGGLLGDEA